MGKDDLVKETRKDESDREGRSEERSMSQKPRDYRRSKRKGMVNGVQSCRGEKTTDL